MRILLFIIAAILIIIWAVGVFAFNAGNAIHALPVIAIVAVIQDRLKENELIYMKKNQTWKVMD